MSIKNKIIGYYSITLMIVFILFIFISGMIISKYMYSEIKDDLYEEARVTSLLLTQYIESNEDVNSNPLSSILEALKTTIALKLDSKVGYFFYNRNTKTFIGNNNTVLQIAEPAILESIDNGTRDVSFSYDKDRYVGIVYRIESTDSMRKFSAIAKNKTVNLYLFIYIRDSQVKLLISNIIKKQIAFLILALAVVLFIGIMIAKSITKPLRVLHSQTLSMAKRNYDILPEIKGNDEIGQLAASINDMAMGLKQYEQTQHRFLQNASHELKTPLMSIKGYAEGMIDGLVEKNEENLNIIIEESDRLRKIVEGISFLSKIESKSDFMTFEPRKVNETINDAIMKVNGLALTKRIRLEAEHRIKAVCLLDEEKMIQALLNIYSNGIRYAKSVVRTSINKEANNVIITITDDGEGFDDRDLPYVFERFYKGPQGENGLGLAIAKAIILKHHGTISAMNDENDGAKFIIRIPMKEEINDQKE